MDRARSDHLDDLLLSLSRLEYRDFVGVDKGLAGCLIKLFETMEAMLEYEIKVRDVQTFMPINKQPHKSNSGAWPA